MLDSTSSYARLMHVREQLHSYSGAKKVLSDSTLVCCPFHADKTPSGRIYHGDTTKFPGYFKCYGCGAKAKWDEVAVKLGLKPFKQPKPTVEYARDLTSAFSEPEDEANETRASVLNILGDLPARRKWRGIKTSLLIDLGAKLCNVHYPDSDFTTKNFIYLPCVVRKRLRGYIRARLRKEKGKPSYLNSKGKWSRTHGLFPLDYSVGLMSSLGITTLVIVEGPRDALRLLSFGIPAVSILGTQSWSPQKAKLIELAGVETVVLMMDGDTPGRKSARMLRESLSGLVNVRTYRLPDAPEGEEAYDPGNCPVEFLTKLKRRLKIA